MLNVDIFILLLHLGTLFVIGSDGGLLGGVPLPSVLGFQLDEGVVQLRDFRSVLIELLLTDLLRRVAWLAQWTDNPELLDLVGQS
jgi:hypothetical protein